MKVAFTQPNWRIYGGEVKVTGWRRGRERMFFLMSKVDILFLKHASSLFRQSSNTVCGFSMMEQVGLGAVCLMENWLGTSKTTYRVG